MSGVYPRIPPSHAFYAAADAGHALCHAVLHKLGMERAARIMESTVTVEQWMFSAVYSGCRASRMQQLCLPLTLDWMPSLCMRRSVCLSLTRFYHVLYCSLGFMRHKNTLPSVGL